MTLEIHILPLLVGTYDNYAYLIKDPSSQKTAVIDPSEAGPVLTKLKDLQWNLDFILNTHHHGDHTGGNLELARKAGAQVVGFSKDRNRIPGIQIEVDQNHPFDLGESRASILEIPGHTLGHIAFYFMEAKSLFCGDMLFSLGCGRLFEGSPEMMWKSLLCLRALPKDTKVYCGHEYTQKNAQFALSIEPNNQDLIEYVKQIERLRANNKPTIPSTIGLEIKTNPFLRADVFNPKNPIDKFAELRKQKDSELTYLDQFNRD